MKFIPMLAALGALAACSAAAQTSQNLPAISAQAPAVACEIRVTDTRHGVRFAALASAPTQAGGEYEFTISKDGAGGSSDIVQGGEFEFAGGGRETLGAAELNLGRGDRYRARLALWDGDGEVCRAERRS